MERASGQVKRANQKAAGKVQRFDIRGSRTDGEGNQLVGYIPDLAAFSAPTPFVRRSVVVILAEDPNAPPRPKVERPVKPGPDNTVAMPIDSGEYLYYHKSTGKFYPLPWTKDIQHDIVLNEEEMVVARAAFRKRWPEGKWIAESHYDINTGKFFN